MLCFCIAFSKEIIPTVIIPTKGFVTDFIINEGKIFIANDEGSIEIYDLKQQKMVDEVILPKLYSVKQEYVSRRILSIDRLKGKILMTTTSLKGFTEVYLFDGKKFEQLVGIKDKMAIKEARFINKNNFLFATLGHEVILYNKTDNYKAYEKHVEQSAFSDVKLSSDKRTMITASESGRVTLLQSNNGKVLNTFESLNVDNIYKVDYQNGVIITAGQDRRVGVYTASRQYYLKSSFLVYTVALSPSANKGVYSSDEFHNLTVFDVQSKKVLHRLKGHYSTPTNIKFVSENELFSSGDEKRLFYWRLF
jgi:WD40 repeat protein